jgi:predicted small metal-binding protein
VTLGDEEGKREAALPPGQTPFVHEMRVVFDRDAAGQIDPGRDQGSAKVCARFRQRTASNYRPGGGADMQKIINCPCGFVVKAETDDQLVAKAQAHAKETHQMDLTREQALATAKPA